MEIDQLIYERINRIESFMTECRNATIDDVKDMTNLQIEDYCDHLQLFVEASQNMLKGSGSSDTLINQMLGGSQRILWLTEILLEKVSK